MASRLPSVGFIFEDLPDKTKNERVIEKRKVTKLFISSIVSPFITSAPVLAAEEALVYTYALIAAGSTPIEWQLIDSPHSSLSIDRDSGVISWISPVSGSYLVKVRGKNSFGINEQEYTLIVTPCLI